MDSGSIVKDKKARTDAADFEKSLEKLEEIAKRLENKELAIEAGISLYEEGLALAKDCLRSLSESKGRISVLTKEMDKLVEEPLE